MPLFTYAGDAGRYYIDAGVTANPGDVVDFPEGAPDDGRWSPVSTSSTTSSTSSAPPPDPSPAVAPDAAPVTDPTQEP